MKKQIWGFILLASLAWSNSSIADERIEFGTPALSGAGCPQNTVQFSTAPDASSLSLLFDQMLLQNTKVYSLLNCQVRIPIKLKKGYRLEIETIDMRGFQDLAAGATSVVGVQTRFMNRNQRTITHGSWATRVTRGPVSEEFAQSFPRSDRDSFSFCGQEQYLVIDTGIWLWNWQQAENLVALDSVDAGSQIKARYKVKNCR